MMEPESLPLNLLLTITDNFSDERKVGSGRYGDVYRGVTPNGEDVAVKRLRPLQMHDSFDFSNNEIHSLTRVQHRNLVRLIGYCYERQNKYIEFNGKLVFAGETTRALCFEYVQNGSLDRYISDESCGLDWQTRHRIIKGTCEGLYCLHNALERPIFHLDLEPAHILLDKNMTAKISDFGLSRYFSSTKTLVIDDICKRANEYMPPEYKDHGTISDKLDVFSLGVIIIKIMAGNSGYALQSLMRQEQFIKFVTENWKERLQGTSQQIDILRVKTCVDIALRCVEADPHRRPSINEIIYKLEELEVEVEKMSLLSSNQSKDLARMKDIHEGYNMLECIVSGSRKPSNLKLTFLEYITENFSDELKIGNGGCGVVYKGILRNGTIAVKRLLNSRTIDGRMFYQEVKTMMIVNHKNVVKFLGYCSNTEELAHQIKGEFNMAEDRERLLCFEYISSGSLENYLTDELRGLRWQTRYQIIRGICDGLDHLHRKNHIIHMDLKPANILLDIGMVPKITDFGLSRLDGISHTMSTDRLLSLGYCAPEYMIHGKMSAKSDIYSLGVIILALLTGSREKPNITKVNGYTLHGRICIELKWMNCCRDALVHRRWKHRWTKSTKEAKLESAQDAKLGYKQVAKCLDLAQRCTHMDPADRPNIWDVISDLNKMDSTDVHISDAPESLELEDMLGIEPLEVHLLFELNKQISCSIELTNDTDDHFAFRISPTSPRTYCIEANTGILQPRSNCKVAITLQALENALPSNRCRDEFSVQSTRVDGSLTETDIGEGFFREEIDKVVDTVHFTITLSDASPSVDR